MLMDNAYDGLPADDYLPPSERRLRQPLRTWHSSLTDRRRPGDCQLVKT
jgi:hypothetical protein